MKEFHGWADGLDGHKKIEYPIQAALYEVKGDCDWNLNIRTFGSDVRESWDIHVVAQRHCVRGWKGKIGSGTIEICAFSFSVPSYTLKNIYEQAKISLKETIIRKFEY